MKSAMALGRLYYYHYYVKILPPVSNNTMRSAASFCVAKVSSSSAASVLLNKVIRLFFNSQPANCALTSSEIQKVTQFIILNNNLNIYT